MDMGMNMPGLPWLRSPLSLHSSRANKCKLTPARCAYRQGHWRYWYQADHVYAQATVYFICAVIAVFTIAHLTARFAPRSLVRSRVWQRAQAPLRYLAYKGHRVGFLRWSSPALGVVLLGLAGAVFYFGIVLGPRPYYWPNTRDGKVSFGDSPPLATRSGWLALALLPFVIALSAKANMISALTGVSYEKLQVFHHWTSYAMFVLALVHTFPFIVFHRWKGDMKEEWMTSMYYWTGVAALVPQAWLTMMSFAPIRNRFYEFFKATHYIIALFFVLMLFFHCNSTLTSWDYFIATGVIYLLSLGYATGKTILVRGLRTATIERLPCGFVRVAVDMGKGATWAPGQHVFLRFLVLGVHGLTSHPFTICSVTDAENPQMVFYMKPHRGFTQRLAHLAEQKPGGAVRVFVEGPYSGVMHGAGAASFADYDEAILIAGGSGAGFLLALVEDTLRRATKHALNLRIVLATPSPAVAQWIASQLHALFDRYPLDVQPHLTVAASVHVSGLATGSDTDLRLAKQPSQRQQEAPVDEKADPTPTISVAAPPPSSDAPQRVAIVTGRPDLGAFVRGETTAGRGSTRVGIAVCGPHSMLSDVRVAAAAAQLKVAKGERGELFMHSEHFGW